MVQMELETISWDLYYLQAIGSVSSRSSILYYLKTYNTNPVDENTIIEQGRALHVSGEETFRISVRTQGVYMVYLLAKDTTTLCNSPVLTIPLFSAFGERMEMSCHLVEEKSPLHIWSPQLHFSSAGCILTCSISSPSFLYFLLEKNPSSHDTHRKTSQEIRSLGFDGGRFADEASFFIGSLADAGNYHMWMVLEADGKLSDPYLYEFVIPGNRIQWESLTECFLEGSISLLHSIEDDQEALSLSVEVKVASYPVSLVILAELRDKHGIRPSADDVSRRGQAFEISSSEVTVLNVFFMWCFDVVSIRLSRESDSVDDSSFPRRALLVERLPIRSHGIQKGMDRRVISRFLGGAAVSFAVVSADLSRSLLCFQHVGN